MSVTRICLRARNFLPGGLNKAVSRNPRGPRQKGRKGRNFLKGVILSGVLSRRQVGEERGERECQAEEVTG